MYPCTLLNTHYRTRSIGQWWVTGHTARHLWTLRVSDTEEGLRVPPVIVPCLHPSTDPFPTRTDMSLRRGIKKYHGKILWHYLDYKLMGNSRFIITLIQIRIEIGDRHTYWIAEETSATSNPGSFEGKSHARFWGTSKIHETSQQAVDIQEHGYGRWVPTFSIGKVNVAFVRYLFIWHYWKNERKNILNSFSNFFIRFVF